MFKKIKIGLAGDDKETQKYLHHINNNPSFELVGSFDTSFPKNFENFYGLYPFTDFVKRTDVVLFCGNKHLNTCGLIVECIRSSKHLIIDKFPDLNYSEWSVIQKLAREADIVFYVSNIMGNSCQYIAAKNLSNKPHVIKSNIQIPYSVNFSDIHIKEMLMENIDMVLRCVHSPIQNIKIKKHYVFNSKEETPDEIKFFISFDNSSSAEITVNKLGNQFENTFVLYQNGKVINADFKQFKLEELRLISSPNPPQLFELSGQNPSYFKQEVQKTEKNIIYFDVIQKDLLNFVDCLNNHVSPLVSIDEAIDVVTVLQDLAYNYNEIFA